MAAKKKTKKKIAGMSPDKLLKIAKEVTAAHKNAKPKRGGYVPKRDDKKGSIQLMKNKKR